MLTSIDLFAGGVGGFTIAAELAGFTTIGQVENDEYNIALLEKHWPNVPRWRDIRSVTAEEVRRTTGIERPTLIVGGPPCQPASYAGKRRGAADDRWLWPEALRLVAELQPSWVCFENPLGILSMGIDDILAELEGMQYEARPVVLPASAVGAPHQRLRVFILGHSRRSGCKWKPRGWAAPQSSDGYVQPTSQTMANDNNARSGTPGSNIDASRAQSNEGRNRQLHSGTSGCGEIVADASTSIDEWWNELEATGERQTPSHATGSGRSQRTPSEGTRPTQSGLGGLPDGIAAWMDRPWPALRDEEQKAWEPPRCALGIQNRMYRIRALGNAVVWKQCYPILKGIADFENGLLGDG